MEKLDIALVGIGLITAGYFIAGANNKSSEAWSMSLQAQCAATVTAAAVVELAGGDCLPESGHPPSIVELCRLTHGRTAKQVANLPQCKNEVSRVPNNQGS